MQINVNILDVQIENKGKYKMATVDYKDVDSGKANSRKVSSFGASEKAFLFLASQNPRGNYVVTAEKIGDYWNWTHIEKAASNAQAAAPAVQAAAPPTYAPRVDDEKKQRLIVRQNALGHAINLITLNGNKKATVDDVVALASRFEDFVFDEFTPEFNPSINVDDDIQF